MKQILLILIAFVIAQSLAYAQDWSTYKSKDELTGEITEYSIRTTSYNVIEGRFGKEAPQLAVICGKRGYRDYSVVLITRGGLESKIKCGSSDGSSECIYRQRMRFKFDNIEKPVKYAGYTNKHGRMIGFNKSWRAIDSMKEAREVWIEFKLTDGRKVVAKFGLLGFSEELKECDDLVIQKDNSN